MTTPESVVNPSDNNSLENQDTSIPDVKGKWRLLVYSAIGAFVFFFPMDYQGKTLFPWTTWSLLSGKQSQASCRG